MKKLFYKFKYYVKNIVQMTWLTSGLGILLGLYYGTLDIWGDKWTWIVNYETTHEKIYATLMVATIISVCLKSWFDYSDKRGYHRNNETLNKFLLLLRNIVKVKRDRFHNKVSNISNNSRKPNFFERITMPDEQLECIMKETQVFFESWDIPKDNLDMTVMWLKSKKGENPTWNYVLKLDKQRQHTQASQIMSKNSLAKKVIETGQSIFLPNLQEGINKQIFFASKRATENQNIGSIYCRPVTVEIQENTYKYVFSLVSYGIYLCPPNDKQEIEYLTYILNEIGDRIELELYLHAMKNHTLK